MYRECNKLLKSRKLPTTGEGESVLGVVCRKILGFTLKDSVKIREEDG